ncbi:SDR family NAD(P)-dependent oxidoreductase [Amycolatopsis rhabdoformis]|uniref:SDR family NAD(P)-dependent oxidoreductase n=1 Tax=Amycolatopsis rhabdoformis TaxID=1448059 RepID=A0ABZ1IE08_9PSEU|nr:SDR family NAD(P)-dependent oxidoreductase [Amycolatopsis rhabdoformis]WSE32497.1 SDR family NAD(P)-dependent oxidoreductase [Amycolatopsis rhabdoformis]
MTRFAGKVALVTGGASGIGYAIGEQLVAEGASVVLFDLNAEKLEVAARKLGSRAAACAGDVRDEAAVAAAVGLATERFGGLDAAFGAAGSVTLGSIVDIAPQDWLSTVDVILKGTFLTTRHAARAMRVSGRGGAIVHVSSLNAHVPVYGGSAYSAAKAGIENFSKSAALELAGDGIRVNTVLPGLVTTPLTEPFLAIEELAKDYTDRIPVHRPATPEEIAGPCLFLAGAEAAYVTGTSLVVDGGWEISNYPNTRPYA